LKTFTNFYIIVCIIFAGSLQAAPNSDLTTMPLAKGARHTLMPFVGYQILEGEQMGFKFSVEVFDPVSFVLVTVNEDRQFEHDSKSPEMGLIYRYQTPIRMLKVEAGISLIQDAENYSRSYIIDFGEYTQSGKINISHRNTLVSSLSLVFDIPMGMDGLSSSIFIGSGYGKRSITGNLDREFVENNLTITDSDELIMARVGLETALWNKENFLLKGSIYYTQMTPMDGRNDQFGGIGWSFGFFPIWSERR